MAVDWGWEAFSWLVDLFNFFNIISSAFFLGWFDLGGVFQLFIIPNALHK